MVTKLLEDGLIVVGEDAGRAGGHVDEPRHPVPDVDRDRERRDDPLGPGDRHVVRAEPGILGVVVGPVGPPGQEHLAGDAFPRLEAVDPLLRGPGTREIADRGGLRPGLPERDVGHVASAQVLGPVGHPLEDVVEVQGDVDPPGQLGDDLRLAPASLGRLLRALLRGDVHHDPAQLPRPSVSVRDHTHDVTEPDDAAVRRERAVLEVVAPDLGGRHPAKVHRALTVVRVEVVDPGIRLRKPLFDRVAQDRLGLTAHEGELPGRRIGLPDDGVEPVHEVAEAPA